MQPDLFVDDPATLREKVTSPGGTTQAAIEHFQAQGFEKIALYGIDMSRSEEYRDQRPSCEYFIGVARGMGIDVFVPEESSLLRSAFLYGKEEQKRVEMDAKLHAHKDELVAKRTNIVNSVEELQKQQHQVEGSIASLDYVIKEFMPVDDF